MQLEYDEFSNELQLPIIVLATKNQKKLGAINNIIPTISCNFINADEISFRVYKELDGKKCKLWDKINNLKLIWVKELNEYFEINVTINDDKEEYKDINCTSLCEAELSQILLHNIEINTDSDIERDEYISPTVFFNENNQKSSLLHRVLSEKAPHYKIGYISETLKKIQRTFSFDNVSILDALNEIEKEIGCIFLYDTTTRTINAYDLYLYCHDCGKRYDTLETSCPECGSNNVILPYGDRTQIFFSTENIAENLNIEYNIDQYKNCFKLKTGDDYLGASVRMINPNGTDYIYNISELMKEDMSPQLLYKLTEYNNLYNNIIENYTPSFESNLKTKYNDIVEKYNSNNYANYKYDDNGERILQNNTFMNINDITNYSKFSNLYFDIIDFKNYLNYSLLPAIEISETNATNEILKLTNENLSPTSVSSLGSSTSKNTIENAIKNYVLAFIVGAYKIDVNTLSYIYDGVQQNGYNKSTWKGTITLTRYGDENDKATTSNLTIIINDDYEKFIQQKLNKVLNNDDEDNIEGSIFNVINIKYTDDDSDFKEALKYYNLNRLNSFKSSYQACLNVLIELDQASEEADLYETLYLPNYNRLTSIENEISIRSSTIKILDLMLDDIELKKNEIKNQLDIKEYLGEELWLEFCAYRREDIYENTNYISDGLDNSQLINNAKQFYELAQKELQKSSNVGITISGSLINFMSIKEFQQIMKNFNVGIWVNAKVNDVVYNVRLSSYEINFDDLKNCPVTFSDVVQDYKSPTEKILDEAKSMTTGYSYIQKQVDNSKESIILLKKWREDGLDLTNQLIQDSRNQNVVMDKNGILLRTKDDITEQFSPEQTRLVNSTIAITDDNWKTIRLALGKMKYNDPETGKIKTSYGLNAETLVGSLILGEKLGIYSGDRSLKFDSNGLVLNTIPDENGVYSPIFQIQKDGKQQMYIDNDGNIVLNNLTANNGVFNGEINATSGTLDNLTATNLIVDSGKFTGKINATSGYIGGFIINENKLMSNTYSENYLIKSIYDSLNSYINFEKCLLAHNNQDIGVESSININSNGIDIKKYTTTILDEFIKSDLESYLSVDINGMTFYNEDFEMQYSTDEITCISQKYLNQSDGMYNNCSISFTNGLLELSSNSEIKINNNLKVNNSISATTFSFGNSTNKIIYNPGDGGIEIHNGYLDFHRNNTTDFDMRLAVFDANNMTIDGGNLVMNNGAIYLPNNYSIYSKDTNNVNHGILSISTSNNVVLGYGSPGKTNIYCNQNNSVAIMKNGATAQGLLDLGDSFNSSYASALRSYWVDGSIHNLVERGADGLSSYLGWAGSASRATITRIRGRTCQYQNASGTTALSDKNLKKDFKDFDERYEVFFDNCKPLIYKYILGSSNRSHSGYITQNIEEALQLAGLTTKDFAGVNIMSISKREQEQDENGNMIDIEDSPDNYLLDKGFNEQHNLVYTEFISLIHWQLQKTKSKVNDLTTQVSDLQKQIEILNDKLNEK